MARREDQVLIGTESEVLSREEIKQLVMEVILEE